LNCPIPISSDTGGLADIPQGIIDKVKAHPTQFTVAAIGAATGLLFIGKSPIAGLLGFIGGFYLGGFIPTGNRG